MGWILESRASVIICNLISGFPEDKMWFLPTNVCPIVVACFIRMHRRFEFIDLGPNLCMDVEQCKEKLAKKPQAYSGMLFVHTYGLESDFSTEFNALRLIKPDFFILQDKCLGLPEFGPGQNSTADAVLYSTGYSKYIDLGWGGYASVKDVWAGQKNRTVSFEAESLKMLDALLKESRLYSPDDQLFYSNWLDCRLPAMDFDLYRLKVTERLEATLIHKKKLNEIYAQNISSPESFLPRSHCVWRFNLCVMQRDKLLESIVRQGLFASRHYASLSGRFQPHRVLPNAQALQEHVINLFNDHYFTEDQAVRVSEIVNEHIKNYGYYSSSLLFKDVHR